MQNKTYYCNLLNISYQYQLNKRQEDAPDVRAAGEYLYFCASNHVDTRWKLEYAGDSDTEEGVREYHIPKDKSDVQTDLPHDLVGREEGIKARRDHPWGSLQDVTGVIEVSYSRVKAFGLSTGLLSSISAL